MERILLSSKKTGLHDNVLQIIYMHMDPLLPLPRLRMISVTYFFLVASQHLSIPIVSCVLFVDLSHLIYFIEQVLYHVLGIAQAYQSSIGPALNELCLGLQPDEVAPVCSFHPTFNVALMCIRSTYLRMCFFRLYTGFMQKMFTLEWPV